MDASALLKSQGWLGHGYSLDARPESSYKQKGKRGLAYDPTSTSSSTPPTHSPGFVGGNGLVKPLLISQRKNNFGIGKKAHEPSSGNEWWLKGFAAALGNFGKTEAERASAPVSVTGGSATGGGYTGKHGGLYGYFTRGQVMQGTIDEVSKKRKSDVLEDSGSTASETEKSKKRNDGSKVKSVRKGKTADELEGSMAYLAERDKDRKKAHSRSKDRTSADKFVIAARFLETAERADMKERADSLTRDGRIGGPVHDVEESKEERRARKKKIKKEKEGGQLSLAEMVEEELVRLSSIPNSEENSEDEAARKARRAERKRRKAEKVDKASRIVEILL